MLEHAHTIEQHTFLIPLIAGLGTAIASAQLGIFVIAQRLSFFSDALAHAALLGISISLLFSLPVNISFVAMGLLFAVVFSVLLTRSNLSSDTLIGVLAHSFLAYSLFSISFFADADIDLEHYLFGDLLHVQATHLIWIALCLLLTSLFLKRYWQDLILLTLHEDLAKVEGVPTKKIRLILTLLLALLVAVSIQLIGALLISALIIIPASSAYQLANSPKKMLLISCCFSCIAVTVGLLLSYFLMTPSGPSIVVIASIIFIFSLIINNQMKKQ